MEQIKIMDKLMLCDAGTSRRRYSGYYFNMVVPKSEERLLGKERLNHDLHHGEIIYKYRNGDESISEETYNNSVESLIADNIELAYKWAMDFVSRKKDFSRLYTLEMACSDALYALTKFIKDEYDYTKGYVVSTGAKMNIIRELQNSYNVAVFGNTSQRILGYINDVKNYINKHPDYDVMTIAEDLRMRVDTVYSVLNLMKGVLELDGILTFDTEYESTYHDIISKESLDDYKHEDLDRKRLKEMLSTLSEKERAVVLHKSKIDKNLSTSEVLNKYGIDKDEYNNIYEQSLNKLRAEAQNL